MVFIHGGAFVSGTANDPLFDGAKLAQAGLIVVTVNYRLGALGWLSHPALSDAGSGNFGLMDQLAALHWVHDNIAAFGGDPDNVTLFGSDAGATSIALLMLSDQARDLFHKAILQSVAGRARLRSAEEAEAIGREFVAALGPNTDPRTAEPRRVLAAEKQLLEKSPRSFAPLMDGRLATEDLTAGFAAGRESRIPVIIGSNEDETGSDNESAIKEELVPPGTSSEEWRKLYADLARPSDFAARFYTDKVFSEPVRLLARLHAAGGAPTFRYRFAYVPESRRANPDAGHGRELQFIFGAEGVPGAGILSRHDREVARRLRAYWINFAKSGDPNGPDLPRWDAAGGDRLLLITNDGIASGDDPFADRLDWLANEGSK
jgi:para-nitrobenzyl esterase